jgi:hypothetical protein
MEVEAEKRERMAGAFAWECAILSFLAEGFQIPGSVKRMARSLEKGKPPVAIMDLGDEFLRELQDRRVTAMVGIQSVIDMEAEGDGISPRDMAEILSTMVDEQMNTYRKCGYGKVGDGSRVAIFPYLLAAVGGGSSRRGGKWRYHVDEDGDWVA